VDRRAVDDAMRRCDVLELAARPVPTLSGGERQRARVARALAQEAATLALDEPTAALDVAHEMAIFELLSALGHAGKTVLLVTHNLNLAARYADRLVLLDGGRLAAEGTPAEVLTRETVERVYGWPVEIAPHPGPGPDAGAPQVVPLAGDQCHRMRHPGERGHAA
jgi:iron complex transport system ATP-binding protein